MKIGIGGRGEAARRERRNAPLDPGYSALTPVASVASSVRGS
jgi:hypothetical protein